MDILGIAAAVNDDIKVVAVLGLDGDKLLFLRLIVLIAGAGITTGIIRLPAELLPNAEVIAVSELKGAGGDEVLDGQGSFICLPVTLAVTLGLRRGEALGLQWDDIDFANKTVTIRHSVTCDKEGFTLGAPKTKSSRRTLMLLEILVDALQKEQISQRERARFVGPGFNVLRLVCCREDGKPITTNALQHCFKDALRAAELPGIRFHDLRHTNATLLLRNGIPAKIISAMLGHSSIGITMDLYSHVTVDMQGGAVQVINELLK